MGGDGALGLAVRTLRNFCRKKSSLLDPWIKKIEGGTVQTDHKTLCEFISASS
jgi:hypothetical protein